MEHKIAFLFSGQGSQAVGMGKDFFDRFPASRAVYEQASAAMGFDVAQASFEGAEGFNETRMSQPLIYTFQTAVCASLAGALTADGCAGHSLGEYAALSCCGALGLETGFRVIKSRASHMQDAAQSHPGAMFAVMKASAADIEDACAKAGGYCVPVNYNSPAQTVIAGEETAVCAAAKLLSERGARCVRLAVNAAFHSALMEQAAARFFEDIKDIPFSAPSIPFYSNLSGARMDSTGSLPQYLQTHLVSPVRFTDELHAMAKDGYNVFIEIGSGKTLSSFVKKTLPDADSHLIDSADARDRVLSALGV